MAGKLESCDQGLLLAVLIRVVRTMLARLPLWATRRSLDCLEAPLWFMAAQVYGLEREKIADEGRGWRGLWLGGALPRDASGAAAADTVVILYMHGGAFTSNDQFHYLAASRVLPRLRAKGLRAHFLAVQYTLSREGVPKHTKPIPQPLQETCAAFEFLLHDCRLPASRVLLMGDSAGGNLAIGASMLMRSKGLPPPQGVVAVSPWVAVPGLCCGSATRNAGKDFLHARWISLSAAAYLGELPDAGEQPLPSLISPTLASAEELRGLPRTLLTVSERELLFDDIVGFAKQATAAGAEDVRLLTNAGGMHNVVLHPLADNGPGADIEVIADFIVECLAPPAAEAA